MTERQVQTQIMKQCGSLPHVRLFRNSVGVGWVGRHPNLTKITFGLTPGSADLIGWRRVAITREMVGQDIAQFVSIEVKRPGGRVDPKQINWRNQVERMGGLAIITHIAEEALSELT